MTACGAGPEPTSPTPSIQSQESFIYKPAGGLTQGSRTITHVYLCGTFNSWNETSDEMTWDPTKNQFEHQLQLNQGSYQYKYKIVYSSGNPDWFADSRALNTVDDGAWGLNSIRTVPSNEPTLHTATCQLANIETHNIYFFKNNPAAYRWQSCSIINPPASPFSWNCTAAAGSYRIELQTIESETNISMPNFAFARYDFQSESSNIIIPSLTSLSYNTVTLEPYNGTHSRTNVPLSWSLPQGLGSVINITVYVVPDPWGTEAVISGLSPSATNYHFQGDPAITGNGQQYRWYLKFEMDTGWIFYTRAPILTLL